MVSSDPQDGAVLGPAVAGSWYPDDRDRLARQVDELLKRPSTDASHATAGSGRVRAMIAPHAGFSYSGAVAGAVFHRVTGEAFARVILLGPSHYEAFDGAMLPRASRYRTPLGEIEIDRRGRERLAARPGFQVNDRPFVPEHCLEAEIPFLQRALPAGFRLLPLLIGAGSPPATLDRVAEALALEQDSSTLLVVSSDFTHYGARFGYVPFADDLQERIRRLDMGAVDRILRLDRNAFDQYQRETGITICGCGPIAVLIRMLPAETVPLLIDYDTSGRMTGDWEHTVSYAGLVFHEPPAAAAP